MTARYATAARLRELEPKLGDRELAVIHEIAALRFVSGSQVARLCFARMDGTADQRAARRALLRLSRLGVVDRLPRPIGGIRRGSSGFVYYLGPAGQRLSMERGWLTKRRPRRPALPGQLFVHHALAVAELHARLAEADRIGRFELLRREAEPNCWRKSASGVLKPDTYIRLARGDYEYSYFIEVDRGTEGSGAIQRQLDRYLRYYRSGYEQEQYGVFPKVLWLATEADRINAIAELVARPAPAGQELFRVAHFDDALSAVASENENS